MATSELRLWDEATVRQACRTLQIGFESVLRTETERLTLHLQAKGEWFALVSRRDQVCLRRRRSDRDGQAFNTGKPYVLLPTRVAPRTSASAPIIESDEPTDVAFFRSAARTRP